MISKICAGLVAVCAVIVLAGFFQPWAEVSTSVGNVSGGLTGILKGTFGEVSLGSKVIGGIENLGNEVNEVVGDVSVKKSVSGAEVPGLVNSKSSKMALAIAEIMFKSAEGLSWKSYAVYLIPGLAVLCVLLAGAGLRYPAAFAVMTVLSGAVSGAGLYNLYNADLSNTIVKISIGYGLWNSLYAFGGIAVIGAGCIILEQIKKRKAG